MKFDLKPFVKATKTACRKHLPEILTGIGVIGAIACPIMAVKATPSALEAIERDSRDKHDGDPDAATKIEIVKSAWKYYVPSMITGGMAVACIVGASAVNMKRNAALATAYALSESALKEYKDAVLSEVGEKKEQSIRDRIAGKRIEDNPVDEASIIDTKSGDVLCYDSWTGRYFKSSVESLRKAENELNRMLLRDDYASLNDFYDLVGLPCVEVGDKFGWAIRKGMMELDFSTQLTDKGIPCMVVSHHFDPFIGFQNFA